MTFSDAPQLTEQQQAIVNHTTGPALVFAVAGAGKTTAMVHRIARLVRERVVEPRSILATSFGKATVQDIRTALTRWPACADVRVTTLHAVGNGVLRKAQQRDYVHNLQLDMENREGLPRIILYRALSLARQRKVTYERELETLDQDDFLSYVDVCKGTLRYADLTRAELPASSRSIAAQAEAPKGFPWYLDLYRVYEEIRVEHGWITFDDMLMRGWELLVQHPDLVHEVQSQYRAVLVDEFQDVNLAQSEMLDLITAPHRNYMAIGDDDQTIYEWRGANPQFILSFAERYAAATYLINDNFRGKAAHLALANNVIQHNRVRQAKRLSLTQGFDGAAFVHVAADGEDQGRTIAGEIKAALERGAQPKDIAVLVRVYAQTPYIEQFLIAERIPYTVVGNTPFYQRPEIVTLIQYCRLAVLERALQGHEALSDAQAAVFADAWNNVYNRPKRYLTKELSERIREQVVVHHAPLSRVLRTVSADLPQPYLAERVTELADVMTWLAKVLDTRPARQALQELDDRLGYRDYLQRSSGFPETGAMKAAGVDALVDYARDKGTVLDLLTHLDAIAVEKERPRAVPKDARITLTTIFRAKGLEWPIVVVPDCNQDTLPFGEQPRLEEERRLFYVAVTRTKQTLHLHYLKTKPPSQFLNEAAYQSTLDAVAVIRRMLASDPASWQPRDLVTLTTAVPQLALERYFRTWWDAPTEIKQQVCAQLLQFLAEVEQHDAGGILNVDRTQAELWRAIAPGVTAPPQTPIPGFSAYIQQVQASPPSQPLQPSQPHGLRPDQATYRVGDRVSHPLLGAGVVVNIKTQRGVPIAEIQFPDRLREFRMGLSILKKE